MANSSVKALLQKISDVGDFDAAVRLFLGAISREAEIYLHEGDRAQDIAWRKSRVVAAGVWFRQDAQVRGCRVVGDTPEDPPRLPASLWTKVDQAKGPVAVLIHDGSLVLPEQDERTIGSPMDSDPGLSAHTRALYEAEAATHILGLPLSIEGGLTGLVAVELMLLAWRVSHPPIWRELLLRLTPFVQVPGAVLATLPRREAAETDVPAWAGTAMRPVFEALQGAALIEQSVLLTGPTGTGKSQLARFLHDHSRRARKPFVVVHTASVPQGLVASELFGAMPGAATGVVRELPGLVQAAEGGSLFLDDVHKTPPESQAALLELLEARTWRKLGSDQVRRANVRFIAASSVDLEAEVRAGRFLPDLMYRLQIMSIEVPPMDRRRDELAWWAKEFAEDVHRGAQIPGEVTVAPDFVPVLRGRPLPGNLRSVQALVTAAYARAVVTAPSTGPVLRAAHLPPSSGSYTSWLADLERAADAFLAEARRRADRGLPRLSYDTDAAAFKWLVLARAARDMIPPDVIRLLGTEEQIKSRNAARTVKEAQEAWEVVRRRIEDGS